MDRPHHRMNVRIRRRRRVGSVELLEGRVLLHGAAWEHLLEATDSHQPNGSGDFDPGFAEAADEADRVEGLTVSRSDQMNAPGDPAVVGRWDAIFTWPHVAVHATVLPSGLVMTWSRSDVPQHESAESRLWNPSTGEFTYVDNPYNFFCSGQTLTADGQLFASGGHTIPDGYDRLSYGLSNTSLFDPSSNTWTRIADMAAGRWYPTNMTMANGDILVMAGEIEPDVMNTIPEIWQATGGWRSLDTAPVPFEYPWYPWLYQAPDGRIFYAGPDQTTHFLDTAGSGAWSVFGDRAAFGNRPEGTSLMYEPGKIMVLGGGGRSSSQTPTATVETIDLYDPQPQWTARAAMAFPRRQFSATMLPDGTVLATGGSSLGGWNAAQGAVLAAELWNPATDSWNTLAEMSEYRGYHATTMLLPDGRVLTAGSEGAGILRRNAQIFSPPYLFALDGSPAVRPTITAAPARIGYARNFPIETRDHTAVSRVTLVGLSAVTHWFNSGQRFVELDFEIGASGLTVSAPTDGIVAAPGYYMLFVLDAAGVPSESRIVKLEQDAGFAVAAGQKSATPHDEARAVVLDPQGNSYIAGTRMYADSHSDSTSSGSGDIFIAKYAANGSLLWHRVIGGPGDERANGIARDSAGNIYVVGGFHGAVDFDPGDGVAQLSSAGGFDVFVLKLDAAGTYRWALSFGGSSGTPDIAYGVAIDSQDHALVTGQFGGSVAFGPETLVSAGNSDAFALKLRGDGQAVWSHRFGNTSADRGTGVAVDSNGGVYVTGSFRGTVDFDPGPGFAKFKTAGGSDAFIARLDSAGNFSWARRLGGSQSDEGHAVVVDRSGHLYATGYFRGTASFGPAGPAAALLTSAGNTDVFLAKLDSEGSLVFARRFGGPGVDRGRGLTLVGTDRVAITGHFTSTVDFDVAGPSLTSRGGADAFVVQFTVDGRFVSGQPFGSSGADMGRGLASDPLGNLYTTGFFSHVVTVDIGHGALSLASIGGKDAFLLKTRSVAPGSNTLDRREGLLGKPHPKRATRSDDPSEATNEKAIPWIRRRKEPLAPLQTAPQETLSPPEKPSDGQSTETLSRRLHLAPQRVDYVLAHWGVIGRR